MESALELAGQPVKRGTMAHRHIVYMMLADAAAQLRDKTALQEYAPLLEQLAVRDGHQPYLAVAHRAWGVAHKLDGDYAAAEARLTQALDIFEQVEARWQIGRTIIEMAELALDQADQATARDCYLRALSEFEALKAKPAIERTRAALAALA